MDSAAEMKAECGTVVQQGPPATSHMITGNSEATSSSNTPWADLFRPIQGAGAVVYSCKPLARVTGKKGPIRKRGRVNGRPGSRSICRASGRRAVGSAILCLGAVRALHRDSKDQERAITSTQVPGSPAVQEHFGPGAEVTPETTQLAALGEHGEDHGSKRNAGKHKDVSVASQIIADAEQQGRASGSEVPVDHADTRDDHRTAKHEEVELSSAAKDDRGEVSTGGKKAKIGKNENGHQEMPLHQIAAPSSASVVLDTHGERQARHESHNTTIEDAARYQSEEYPEEEPISPKQGSREKRRESYELRQSVKERHTSGGALRSSHSVTFSSEASGSGTGRGLDYATDLDITVESDLDLILLGTSAASGWIIAGQLSSIWRRIVGFFSSVSAPPEADDLGSSRDDVEFTALRHGRRLYYAAPRNQSSLLEVGREWFASVGASNDIEKIRSSNLCAHDSSSPSSSSERNGHLRKVSVTVHDAEVPEASYFCECRYSTDRNWQFYTLAAAGNGGSPAFECWIHAVVYIANDGAQNDGTFLVRSEPYLRTGEAGAGVPSISGSASPQRQLFCKMLPKWLNKEKTLPAQAENDSECTAAAYFVEKWRANARQHESAGGSIAMTTPFCKPLSAEIDRELSQHTALCMDAMAKVSNSNLLETLTAPAAAKEQGPHQNVLTSTWESIRVLTKQAHIFHRDIKADNFLSTVPRAPDQPPVAWIANDMGLACSTSSEVLGVKMCASEDEAGTPGYMSPDHFSARSQLPENGRAARGDSFSWSVMVVDGARAQCGYAGQVADGLDALLGFNAVIDADDLNRFSQEKKTICEHSILVKMSRESVKSARAAGKLLNNWIAKTMGKKLKGKGRHAQKSCLNALLSLENTMLMPLKREGHGHAEPKPMQAIELVASALLGDPWIETSEAELNKEYVWGVADESTVTVEGRYLLQELHENTLRVSACAPRVE
ncbi:unnamed protein product [Amoebophrya sp. A25]|nr:unnamed protein product [Amoebophrya sp. A25]|eukprot:GSA25T00008328001.1